MLELGNFNDVAVLSRGDDQEKLKVIQEVD